MYEGLALPQTTDHFSPPGNFRGIRIYPPAGDHQASLLGAACAKAKKPCGIITTDGVLIQNALLGGAAMVSYGSEINMLKNDFSAYILLNAEFIKKVGDGQGNITNDTYLLTGGIPSKQVEAKTSAEGDTEQSVSIYNLKFAVCERTLG